MRGQGEARQGGRPSLGAEGGSGVRSEPAADGVWACGLQAACRLQEPAGQVLGARTVAAAFPESPRRPRHLTQAHLGPQEGQGSPRGSACCPWAPHPPSTCPRPTCPLLGALGSGTSLSPSRSRDQPWLGGTGHGGQARWMVARCPGFGVSCSRPGPSLRCPTRPADAGLSLARTRGSDFNIHRLVCPTCEGPESVSASRAT